MPAASSACRSAACRPWPWPPTPPSSCAPSCSSTSRPGVNAEKAAPITNFVNGPASFDSFDELLARTIEHNPGRSESSLRRGILHNAVQREDGSWVWRYARFRTEATVTGRPSRLRRPVGGRLRAHRAAPARARPGLVGGRRRRRRRAAAAPAHARRSSASRARATACRATGRSSWPASSPTSSSPDGLMDKKVWLSRRAIKLHVVILIVVPAFLALCLWQISRALGGNTLSWAYVFEWPLFAAYAVYMWWRFVHEAAEDTAPPATAGADPGGSNGSAADCRRRLRRRRHRRRKRTRRWRPTTTTWPSWPRGTRPAVADRRSGGRARTSNIRLQRPTFCRLNYPGPWRAPPRG